MMTTEASLEGQSSQTAEGPNPKQRPLEASHPSNIRKQPPKELEAALTLLEKSDDTSRFVGLALLKPVLEQQLSNDNLPGEEDRSALVHRCWGALPAKFLDRLLKARSNEKRTKEEAGNTVGLAVAVMHAFMTRLISPHTDEKFMGRVPLLMTTLRYCPPETRTQIMGIFHILSMTQEGSAVLFRTNMESNPDQKPESYLFITMLLIDIRASIPSLQEKLHSADYAAISERLARAYDMISAFIGFLVQSLIAGDNSDDTVFSAPMPVDLLLKLRTNISETMSLTIEHLRDRYDSSTAGAAGLHPSARTPNNPSLLTPLPIAWDTSNGMFEDPLNLSQLRSLSLWLRDEENDALRSEAAGIMDALLALYLHSEDYDFRSPVLVALEGILETPQGVEAFLHEEGWTALSNDLTNVLAIPEELSRGIEIVRVLLTIAESDIAGPTKKEWMSIVPLAHRSLTPSTPAAHQELPVAVAQLAIELLVQAPRGLRSRYTEAAVGLLRSSEKLLKDENTDGESRDGLVEVVEGLESLGLGRLM